MSKGLNKSIARMFRGSNIGLAGYEMEYEIKARGIWDTRNTEGGIRDENILAGSGYAHFNWWDAG